MMPYAVSNSIAIDTYSLHSALKRAILCNEILVYEYTYIDFFIELFNSTIHAVQKYLSFFVLSVIIFYW